MAPKLPQQWETEATGERRDRECVTVGLEEGLLRDSTIGQKQCV